MSNSPLQVVNITSDFSSSLASVPEVWQPLGIMAQITHLSDLKTVTDDDFANVFMKSLENVFQCNQQDISSALESKSFDVLSALRNKLGEQAKTTFSCFNTRALINRRAKHLVIKDICILGDCLMKNIATNDLEKCVFGQPSNQIDSEVHDEDGAKSSDRDLSLITSLIEGLQSSINSLALENRELRESIDTLVANKCCCKCRCGQDDNPHTHSATSPPGANDPFQAHSSTSSDDGSQGSAGDRDSHPDRNVANRLTSVQHSPLTSTASKSDPKPLTARPSSSASVKEVYIGNVNAEHSCNDVVHHLVTKGFDVPPPNIRLLKKTTDSCSFSLKIQEKDFDKVINDDTSVWPAGIKVRPFFEKAPRGSQNGSSKSSQSKKKESTLSGIRKNQPFRRGPKRQQPPKYTFQCATSNRFSPLQYHDAPWRYHDEYDYDREWPELGYHHNELRDRYWY